VELHPAARTVAVDVLVSGAQSRSQLAKKMGLSPATLTRIVRPLLDTGVLVESGAVRTPGRGRSSLPLDVVADDYRFIGVKLTTDSIYAVVTDLRAQILAVETVAEPSLEVPEVVGAVAGVVARLSARAGRPVDAVGVTVGGRVDNGEMVADSPYLHWHDVPFRMLLAREVRAPLYLANDVVGLTMAQQWFGYGRTHADFALLTIGAGVGVGYGLVIDHQVVPTLASPVSHLPVDPYGPVCARGHRGCLTAYVTSEAMTAYVAQAHGRRLTYDEVLALARGGDPAALRVVREAAHALGRTVAAITAFTGVERIIVSGEGVGLADVAPDGLRDGRLDHTAGGSAGLEPIIDRMDFTEWARGAAVVAIQSQFPSRLRPIS
jgi:predicted NBD/HSP70 family sugar kinase